MKLNCRLQMNRDRIVKQCFERLAERYPPQTASFLINETDAFQNPVGCAMRAAIEGVFTELTGEGRAEGFRKALDSVVRIWATQTNSASEALCFINFLRESVLEEFEGEAGGNGEGNGIPKEYILLEDRLHTATLVACDLFVDSRRKIDEIRINEAKAEKERIARVLRSTKGRR